MTITSIEADSQAACTTWFDGTRKETGTFPWRPSVSRNNVPLPARAGRSFRNPLSEELPGVQGSSPAPAQGSAPAR
jgi:hypothetical protein